MLKPLPVGMRAPNPSCPVCVTLLLGDGEGNIAYLARGVPGRRRVRNLRFDLVGARGQDHRTLLDQRALQCAIQFLIVLRLALQRCELGMQG
jgi:hypothetical protein